ncbi:MAG: hypothetical protein IBX53_12185 [Halomonas sp.]|uniref:hypothetical protein n=1 Tax=Halomonas sp. TaxID=1486246 RepID=UPI001A0DBA8B|nr:hypothetical protein [Halomonas sp.]MBE0489827.1 hypothetical protein [Halomonas sp.]
MLEQTVVRKDIFYFMRFRTNVYIGNTNFPPLANQRYQGLSFAHPPRPRQAESRHYIADNTITIVEGKPAS